MNSTYQYLQDWLLASDEQDNKCKMEQAQKIRQIARYIPRIFFIDIFILGSRLGVQFIPDIFLQKSCNSLKKGRTSV